MNTHCPKKATILTLTKSGQLCKDPNFSEYSTCKPFLVPQRPQLKPITEYQPLENFDPTKVFQIQQCIDIKQDSNEDANKLVIEDTVESSIASTENESVDELFGTDLPYLSEYIKLPMTNEILTSICFEEHLIVSQILDIPAKKSESQNR